jgi:sugar lactone lactonase YvrE
LRHLVTLIILTSLTQEVYGTAQAPDILIFNGDTLSIFSNPLESYFDNHTRPVMEKDINLSFLAPDAQAYFANDVAVDNKGNVYISDWYAGVVYKVDMDGEASVFWKNETGIPSGANGLDFHPDGYLLVSLVSVNEKGLFANYGLVKIPVNSPKSAKLVNITNSGFTGFDGLVINDKGNVVGITNNEKTPGGNTLIELSSNNHWESAKVVNSKTIIASTTVAITPKNKLYVINQDFTSNDAKNWTIERIEF